MGGFRTCIASGLLMTPLLIEPFTKELGLMRMFISVLRRLVVVACCCWSTHSLANTLSPFTTDGCSMWMDGTPAQPNLWRHCCVAHDKAYWLGGTEAQRQLADEAIKACVEDAQGKSMADYMYTHIRWGGSPYWFSLYRWGYGWHYWENWKPRGYKVPTADEQAQIDKLLPVADALVAEDARRHAPKTPASDDKNKKMMAASPASAEPSNGDKADDSAP